MMGIVIAIFAVVAIDLFADRDPHHFGSFSRSYFTLFQVAIRVRGSRGKWRGTGRACVCVCVCVRACVRACACVRDTARARARMRVLQSHGVSHYDLFLLFSQILPAFPLFPLLAYAV